MCQQDGLTGHGRHTAGGVVLGLAAARAHNLGHLLSACHADMVTHDVTQCGVLVVQSQHVAGQIQVGGILANPLVDLALFKKNRHF